MTNPTDTIIKLLEEMLDLAPGEVTPESRIIQELGAESIDLLELGVSLSDRFGIDIIDDTIFLRSLRIHIQDARDRGIEVIPRLREVYPCLADERIREMLEELADGPVLRVQDISAYVRHAQGL